MFIDKKYFIDILDDNELIQTYSVKKIYPNKLNDKGAILQEPELEGLEVGFDFTPPKISSWARRFARPGISVRATTRHARGCAFATVP